MNDRNLTIDDLAPLFERRGFTTTRQLAKFLSLSSIVVTRHVHRAGIHKKPGLNYRITPRDAEKVLAVMLEKEGHGR